MDVRAGASEKQNGARKGHRDSRTPRAIWEEGRGVVDRFLGPAPAQLRFRPPSCQDMAAVTPSLGRIHPASTILFLCDMQEKFRQVAYFPQIVSVAARMLKVQPPPSDGVLFPTFSLRQNQLLASSLRLGPSPRPPPLDWPTSQPLPSDWPTAQPLLADEVQVPALLPLIGPASSLRPQTRSRSVSPPHRWLVCSRCRQC